MKMYERGELPHEARKRKRMNKEKRKKERR